VFGDEYNALLLQLEAERHIDYADEMAAVGRLLQAGRADFTVMPHCNLRVWL
jgi:polar amino acid transport system substrate-binding protein